MMRLAFLLSTLSMVALACQPEQKSSQLSPDSAAWAQQEIHYAEGFSIEYGPNYKVLRVHQPYPNARLALTYLLLPPGIAAPDSLPAHQIIRIPVQRLVSTSTTHLPALDMLGSSESLVGFAHTDYISSSVQRERIESGKLSDIGRTHGLNLEQLLALQPELVMTYSMGPADAALESLKRTGIPVVINADYLETSPLGRAEWIKFFAAFYNRETAADSVFNYIVNRYDSVAHLARQAAERPEVFSGVVYGDTWYMPGGKSWAAKFLADAQATYLWADTDITGSIPLPFEQVYALAQGASYWINAADYKSLEALAQADERYQNFIAWQSGNVYTYTAQETSTGANGYLELGYARPDIILADLVSIIHPDIMPGYQRYFYEKLSEQGANN